MVLITLLKIQLSQHSEQIIDGPRKCKIYLERERAAKAEVRELQEKLKKCAAEGKRSMLTNIDLIEKTNC